MTLMQGARRLDDQPENGCPLCGAEEPYVLYDDDKMCSECGLVPGAGQSGTSTTTTAEEWESWREHRDERYSGWTGPDRIKFPGGFVSAYDFDTDF